MYQDPEMDSVFVVFWKLALNLLLLRLLSQFLHVSNEALFENYGLEVLQVS